MGLKKTWGAALYAMPNQAYGTLVLKLREALHLLRCPHLCNQHPPPVPVDLADAPTKFSPACPTATADRPTAGLKRQPTPRRTRRRVQPRACRRVCEPRCLTACILRSRSWATCPRVTRGSICGNSSSGTARARGTNSMAASDSMAVSHSHRSRADLCLRIANPAVASNAPGSWPRLRWQRLWWQLVAFATCSAAWADRRVMLVQRHRAMAVQHVEGWRQQRCWRSDALMFEWQQKVATASAVPLRLWDVLQLLLAGN
eukprot:131158-Chlamydomonas_euryale.AAC.5